MRYTATFTGYILLQGWLVHSADAYKLPMANNEPEDRITAIYFDGTLLSPQVSIANVEAGDGRWFQDSDGIVYINPPTGESVYEGAIRAQVIYYFSKEPNILGTKYHESRLLSVPAMSLRIESRFGGVGQIGGGNTSLVNTDGFFDERANIRWSTVQFKVGVDTASATMASGDYQPFGFWKIQDVRRDGNTLSVQLVEPKAALEKLIPVETYSRDDYPNLRDDDVGKPIQRAYGTVYAAEPICVDPGAKRFKVAGHAIYDLLEVRIFANNVWTAIPFATTDEANGEFTLGAEWADNERVAVDFIGRIGADTFPMYNASEIVEDILTYIGETNLDTSAFDAAFDSLDVGTYPNGLHKTLFKPSFYIDEAIPAQDIIDQINMVAGSFLYVDENGQWHYEVFEPKLLEDVAASFDDSSVHIGSFSTATESRDVFSKVNVKFGRRHAEEWTESYIVEDTVQQYEAQSGAAILREVEAPLFDSDDAEYFAQRLMTTEARPLKKFSFAVPWVGFLMKPGRQVALSLARNETYGVFEILEAKHDLDNNRVSLVCGDRRAWGDSFGWWVADSVADWDETDTDTEKRAANEASGFWHGDDDLADATDSESFKLSRWW